jgi:hypothetical protein
MKNEKIINEIMGVPKSLDPWVEAFYQIIKYQIESEISGGWEYEGSMQYKDPETNEIVDDVAKKTDEIIIPGNEVMDELMGLLGFNDLKEFIKSELFSTLPIWRPEITLSIVGIPNVAYEMEKGNPIEASVNSKMGHELSHVGKIVVFSNLIYDFSVVMPVDGITKKFESDLKSTIAHELLHTHQMFKQLEKGKPSHHGKETMLNTLTQIPALNQIELNSWRKFLHLVYVHLSFEINARVVELYHKFKGMGINTKEEFLKELKNTHIWKYTKELENFSAEDFIKSFELPSTKLDFGNSNPFEMLHKLLTGQTDLEMLKRRGIDVSSENEALKSLINIWDLILQAGNEELKNNTGIDFDMMPVPENAKQDPYLFFKFFEKRFHKKAEKWKRKLYRLSAILLEEN